MKIQQLLETELFRYQQEWINDERPSFVVSPRTGRKSHSSAILTYSVHYGLAKLGVDVPRRWNSSFTTTSLDDSPFVSNITNPDGIRKIVIPDDRPCGFAEDDFNYLGIISKIREVNAQHVGLFRELIKRDDTNEKDDQYAECNNELWDLTNVMGTNDAGYQKYVDLVAKIDALLAEQNLPSLTEQLVAVIEPAVNNNSIGRATASTLPEGNYEVWFEGPYEAHETAELDEEDGLDPYDLDR